MRLSSLGIFGTNIDDPIDLEIYSNIECFRKSGAGNYFVFEDIIGCSVDGVEITKENKKNYNLTKDGIEEK
jgi:hypothetical protein